MSMPALLSHFGIEHARYVTSGGEVIFDGVTHTTNGFTHATHGRVTPVTNHTFHGGKEPNDAPKSSGAWWDDPQQIQPHIDAMEQTFPQFLYVPADDDHSPAWFGQIDTGRGKFMISVIPRHDRGLPAIVPMKGLRFGMQAGRYWVPSPHLYISGNLCIADRDDWNPDEHTVATATAWTAHWLAAYTEWRITRRWPVEGVRARAS